MSLKIDLCGVELKNPLIMASGTYGFGEEYRNFYSPDILGGISSKGLTLHPKSGNKGVRIWETPSGMINSIGLENPGVSYFIEDILPEMKKIDTKIFVNLGGNTQEDYLEAISLFNKVEVDFIELNISCPNVKEGGLAFGMFCQDAAHITSLVRKGCKHKLIVKLSPNGESITEMAKAVEAAGADGISLVNTFQATAVDVHKREFVFENIYAGLSGPAIFPIALRMVRDAAGAVKIPVVGIGGIQSYEDVLAMLMVGARAVEIGTMNFANPYLAKEIIEDLERYMDKNHLNDLEEIIGVLGK